jgi:hypothetical protein
MLHDQLQHDLVEVRPMIPAIPAGEVHDLSLGRLVAVVASSEHHRFDAFTHGEIPHFRVLLHGLLDNVANAEFVEHASHKAEVIQDLAMVRGGSQA